MFGARITKAFWREVLETRSRWSGLSGRHEGRTPCTTARQGRATRGDNDSAPFHGGAAFVADLTAQRVQSRELFALDLDFGMAGSGVHL